MPDQKVTEPGSFSIGSLTPYATHILSLMLDDALPSLTDARYQFKTTAKSLSSPEQPDVIRIDVEVSATARSLKATKMAAKARLRVAVLFRYAGLPTLRKDGALPLELGLTTVSIAYSTVRGIFQSRLAGTSFGKAMLPIVNPQQLWQPTVAAELDSTDSGE